MHNIGAKQAEIHAYHGWGADPDFWNPLKQHIPKNILFKTANRGYFGNPFYPKFDNSTKIRIVFVHSFGLHWCNTAILSKADYLVIFNGFEKPADLKLYDAINWENNIIKKTKENPEFILNAYYNTTGMPSHKDINRINYDFLLGDLHKIKHITFPIIDLDFGSTIIALESSHDPMLEKSVAGSMLKWYVGKKFIEIIDDDSHALPITKSKESYGYLSSLIPIFKHYENNK